jgi:hypothetical protein
MRVSSPAASIPGTRAGHARVAMPPLCAMPRESQKKATALVHRSCSAWHVDCVAMRIAMRADVLGNGSSCGISRHHSRKSLTLLWPVQRGSRKTQVWPAPKTPKGKKHHLCFELGLEQATGMAPPTRRASGWRRPFQLFLPNCGCSMSSGYVAHPRRADYGGVEEAARSVTAAECHKCEE